MIEKIEKNADTYRKAFLEFINDKVIHRQISYIIGIIKNQRKYHPNSKVILVGNGGSNCEIQHVGEDLLGCCKIPTIVYDSVGVITALSNDYGYNQAIKRWIEVIANDYDILICVSSSGQSENILNAAKWFIEQPRMGELITITGFDSNNPLKQLGDVNIHINNYESYGIHELYAGVCLHLVVDELMDNL